MSPKRRFDKIEPAPAPKKESLLQKFSFRRKLELEGVPREQVEPKEEITDKVQRPAAAEISSAGPRPAPRTVGEDVQRAEQQARSPAPRPRPASTVPVARIPPNAADRELELQLARNRASEARFRLLGGAVAVVAIGAAIYFMWKNPNSSFHRGTENGGRREVFEFVVLIIAVAISAIFGRGRRRW